MFEMLVKPIQTVEWRVAVGVSLLMASALSELFAALGAGPVGDLLDVVGVGMLVYRVHQHKKRKAGAGLQGGTDWERGWVMSAQTKASGHKCSKRQSDLKRIVSKKNRRGYWRQGPTEACGGLYSERGEPLPLVFGDPDPTCPCPDCGAPMPLAKGERSSDDWSCTAYPQCRGSLGIRPDGALPPLCPQDEAHGAVRIRPGKTAKFLGCRRYPDCTATLEMDGSPSKYPKKEDNHGT